MISSLEKIYNFKKIITWSMMFFLLLSILDGLNLPSKIQEFLGLYNLVIIIFFIVLNLCLSLRQWWKWSMIGDNDYVLISLWIAIFIWIIGYFIRNNWSDWIFYSNMFILVVLLIVNYIRYRTLVNAIEEREYSRKKENLYELKDLYTGNIYIGKSDIVLVKEEEAYYDLLGRNSIITQLERMILRCDVDKRFIIGLSGKWGSGKTTILNIVKTKFDNNDNIVIIDKFKPWNFQNEISMMESMLEIILKESDAGISVIEAERMKKNLTESLFESNGYWKILRVFGIGLGRKPEEIGKMINEYLEVSKKKLVFIIDDIERADPDRIFLLFNLISNLFYLNHIIYVLSYDKEQLNRIFEQRGVKTEYLKKIVQAEISVPSISKEMIDQIIETCLINLVRAYRMTEFLNDKNDVSFIVKAISSICLDLRDVKIFLNSVLTLQKFTKNYLNAIDMLCIQIIKYGNMELYNDIYRHRRFFVSDDIIYEKECFTEMFLEEKFNQEGKNYFDKLFSNVQNRSYIDMLERLFPYVKHYRERGILKEHGYVSDESHKDLVKNKRICNARYFELYFTEQSNDFVLINDFIKKWIFKIEEKMVKENEKILKQALVLAPNESQYLIIEMLQIYLNDLNLDQMGYIFKFLYRSALQLDDTHMFMMPSARRLTAFLLGDMLKMIQVEVFEEWLEYITNDYRKLYFIYNIINSLGEKKIGSEEKKIYTGRAAIFYDKFIQMGVHIREKRINIYDDEIYQRSNIWAVYHMMKENEKRDGIVDYITYINDIINSKNIYRFLWDMVGDSVGDVYLYSFRKENMEPYFPYSSVNALLYEHQLTYGETEDEKYVRKVYELRDKKEFEGREISEKVEKKLNL